MSASSCLTLQFTHLLLKQRELSQMKAINRCICSSYTVMWRKSNRIVEATFGFITQVNVNSAQGQHMSLWRRSWPPLCSALVLSPGAAAGALFWCLSVLGLELGLPSHRPGKPSATELHSRPGSHGYGNGWARPALLICIIVGGRLYLSSCSS